ncbi:MAG TPA: GNAT family N-acetyltransferase [Steroidobacteraceae bacterium]|jgi:ribosomal-protein-alanine N-acetyltransferase|nr:GNAT family N-acetyltransferase [Steroidobacteraceae bacterium]
MSELRTSRLRLRHWREADLALFAALNADPLVMEFLGPCLSRGESDALARRAEDALARRGFGFWALEVHESGLFAGFVGLSVPGFAAHFTPCVEVGWRLSHAAWGKGYASEAARACLEFGFRELALRQIVAFTARANRRSRAVMERLGMRYDPADDFEHPRLSPADPLRAHVLYRIDAGA